jgi:prepilin signal peptidase PulO-like enzyme (type II secretory pathway)
MRKHPRTTLRVPHLTHNLCQLKLPQGSINGQYQNTLWTAALCGNMWDYLQCQNLWSDTTIDSISWTAFEQAYTRGALFKHCVTLVKHFHGILSNTFMAFRQQARSLIATIQTNLPAVPNMIVSAPLRMKIMFFSALP